MAVEVVGLTKYYGEVLALNEVDLAIGSGKYFVLLGPSGGGKTTLLRLLGGFIRPSSGRILLQGKDISDVPPNGRPTSMVFQNFALFPHMTVAQNVGYGLRIRKLPARERSDRTEAMLEMVGMAGLGQRKPHELSGGQQQRVQLARSLVLETKILLLDEPLASLDAKLRKDMCIELKRLQEKVGITFVHVTHNQEEAMTVADDLAIIANGELVEVGKAVDLYENPVRRFTADFVGENNLFDGSVARISDGLVAVDLGFASVEVDPLGQKVDIGDKVSLSVRSELLQTLDENDDRPLQRLTGVHRETVYLGLTTSELIALPDGNEIIVRNMSGASEGPAITEGEDICVGWRTKDGRLHIG